MTEREDTLLSFLGHALRLIEPDAIRWESDEDPIDAETDEAVRLVKAGWPFRVWLRCETELAIEGTNGQMRLYDLDDHSLYWFARGRAAAGCDSER